MTPEEMMPLVIRLDRRYRVRGLPDEHAAMAMELARKLARFDVPTVTRAVEQHIDADAFTPTPNQLLARCLELERKAEPRRPKGAEIRGGPLTPLTEILHRNPQIRLVRGDEGSAA